jgi:polyphosphate kinase
MAWWASRRTPRCRWWCGREADGLRRYCHLGTGNYHPRTARGYTDYSLFTCDPEIGQDVHELFLQLTSLTQTPRLTKLLQSPFGLHEAVVQKIAREADHAAAGRPGRIIAKMNSLVDPQVIDALYRASRAGVQIDLIIRGLCACDRASRCSRRTSACARSWRRFLEHSRVFYLRQRRRSELYLASADWMERNFFRRVEVAFPVREQTHRERILRDLNFYLADNSQAWTLGRDGTYHAAAQRRPRARRTGDLLARYAAGSAPVVPDPCPDCATSR